MAKVTDLVAQLAQPLAEAAGCSLWDVEYVKEAGTWYLRIYIDKETGVSIDDCEAVSRPLSDALDEADPIEGSYTLEVSSAGGRPGAEEAGALPALLWRRGGGAPLPAQRREKGLCGAFDRLGGWGYHPGAERDAHHV